MIQKQETETKSIDMIPWKKESVGVRVGVLVRVCFTERDKNINKNTKGAIRSSATKHKQKRGQQVRVCVVPQLGHEPERTKEN